MNCIRCNGKLTIASTTSDEDVDGFCHECGIYYAGDDPKFLIKNNKAINLEEKNTK